jgi:hypothetical protein
MKKIRHIRQFLQKRKSRALDLSLGLALEILCPSLLAGVATLLLKLPSAVAGILLLLLFLTQSLTLAWLIILHEKYDQCKRYIEKHHPGIDLDSMDEFSDAFNEATRKTR